MWPLVLAPIGPQFPLDVRVIIRLRNNGTIKFSHLLNPNLRNGTTDQFLTVNAEGETVLARHRLRIDGVGQWSDQVFAAGYLLRPLSAGEEHTRRQGHLPDAPSAEEVVREGVDLVRMNTLLLQKVEELTLYSIQLAKADQSKQQAIQEHRQEIRDLQTIAQGHQQAINELKKLVKQVAKTN